MFLLWILSTFAAPIAAPRGLALDPARPPLRVAEADGLPVYRFVPGVEWQVLPAVVLRSAVMPAPGARWLGGPYWRVDSSDPVADALEWRAEGILAFPDVILPKKPLEFDDPGYGGQWYLEELEMPTLYGSSLGNSEVRVAVLDSGIDIAHPDLASAYMDPYDAWSDDTDPSPNPGEYCGTASEEICDGHGTAVAGIVLARANNGAGIVGLCPQCTLVPIKLLGEGRGRGVSVDVAAFEHAIAADVAVINNSWGFIEPTPVPDILADVIHRAATEPRAGLGALVVFAAGNDDRELGNNEMVALPEVLCVSASDSYGRPTNYTNYGDSVALAAPSATVSIAPGGAMTTTFGGTSAAAPVASGLAGWAFSVQPDLSAAELRQLLIDTAIPSPLVVPDENGHDPYYGYGELSAVALWEYFFLVEDSGKEEPQACGCSQGAVPGLAAVAIAVLAVGRRRRVKK